MFLTFESGYIFQRPGAYNGAMLLLILLSFFLQKTHLRLPLLLEQHDHQTALTSLTKTKQIMGINYFTYLISIVTPKRIKI